MPTPDLLDLVKKTKYPLEAFFFVQRGLDFTARQIHGKLDEQELLSEDESKASSRHVSGQDLCHGLRDFAIEQYGLLARTVLKRYRITGCADFGNIVYAMVDAGMMRKCDEDCYEDFVGVYEFSDVFSPELSLSAD